MKEQNMRLFNYYGGILLTIIAIFLDYYLSYWVWLLTMTVIGVGIYILINIKSIKEDVKNQIEVTK